MTKNARAVLLVLVLVGLAVVPATQASTSATRPSVQTPADEADRQGGTLNLFSTQTIGRIDPLTTQANYLTVLAYNTFGQLVHYEAGTWIVVPDLAESWDVSDDGLTYTFRMRPDLTFHDGSPIALSDVVFSLERVGSDISVLRDQVIGIESITADDAANSVSITLAEPDLFLLSKLAGIGGSVIVPEAAITEYGDQFATTPETTIGSGPFRLIEKNETQLVWERFPEFYQPAYVNQIVMRIIPDTRTQQLEFDAGNVDWIGSIQDVAQAERFRNDPQFANYYKEFLAPAKNRFAVNHSMEPFDDIRVRQAISMAIDGALMAEIGGLSAVSYTLLHPEMPGAEEGAPLYPMDVAAAQQLLAEAGYPDGFSTEFYIYDNARYIAQAEVMQQQLAAIGVTININTSEFGTYMSEVVNQNYPFYFALANVIYPDPAAYLYNSFHSDGPFNSGYANPEVDELLTQAIAENDDLDQRVQLTLQAEDLILEDAAVIYIWDRTAAHVFQPWIHGVEEVVPIYPRVRFNTVWIEASRR
ncbi:MAG: ABC transporter substrate-binding protein [Chloroflexota bacterium]|nr:ABC transporter substrate-binding protein [Chloroflexota bacterium]